MPEEVGDGGEQCDMDALLQMQDAINLAQWSQSGDISPESNEIRRDFFLFCLVSANNQRNPTASQLAWPPKTKIRSLDMQMSIINQQLAHLAHMLRPLLIGLPGRRPKSIPSSAKYGKTGSLPTDRPTDDGHALQKPLQLSLPLPTFIMANSSFSLSALAQRTLWLQSGGIWPPGAHPLRH